MFLCKLYHVHYVYININLHKYQDIPRYLTNINSTVANIKRKTRTETINAIYYSVNCFVLHAFPREFLKLSFHKY